MAYTRYTKLGPFTNASASPPINAAFVNGLESALSGQTIPFYAPTGTDQTSDLTAAAQEAQATSGTLLLQSGNYVANLTTLQSFVQPRIIGAGTNLTTLTGASSSTAVVRLKGGSGGFSGGYLSDFTIKGTGGVGLELADCGGVQWDRLKFAGTLNEGVTFHSESSGGYSEYNSGSAEFEPTVVLPVRYKVTSGTGSNHGSGLTQGSLINQSASSTSPIIQIDAGAFPYSAPMSVAIFPRNTNGVIFSNATGNNPASFFGHLDVEVQVAGPITIAATGGARVYNLGTLGGLAASNLRMGQYYLIDKIYYLQGNAFVQPRPYQRAITLAAGSVGPITDVFPQNGSACIVNINIAATNYLYTAQLMCWQNPTSPSGPTPTTLASSLVNNGTAAGAPTFSWANYGLTVTNSNYSGAYTATLSVLPIGGNTATDVLGQY